MHTFEDWLNRVWGEFTGMEFFLTVSAVSHLREPQPVCWTESELRKPYLGFIKNRKRLESVFLWVFCWLVFGFGFFFSSSEVLFDCCVI